MKNHKFCSLKTCTIKPQLKKTLLVMIIFIGFMFFLCINLVDAFEFDNIKKIKETYGKAGYEDIGIENAFGLGDKLWYGTLDSNTEKCNRYCSATQTITLYKKGNLVDEVVFETLQEDGSWIEEPIINYKVYIKTGQESKLVDEHKIQCSKTGEFSKNGTAITECLQVVARSYIKYTDLWEEYILGTELKAGVYEVKLEGEKIPEKSVEWIYKTQGVTLNEWAVWSDNPVFNDLIAYWTCDDSSGDLIDNHRGLINMTIKNGTPTSVPGIINDATFADGDDAWRVGALSVPDYYNLTETNWTINFWFNQTHLTGSNYMMWANHPLFVFFNAPQFRAYFGSVQTISTFYPNANQSYMLTLTSDSTNTSRKNLYVNGVFNESLTSSGVWDLQAYLEKALAPDTNFGFMGSGNTGSFKGWMDEIGIWNQSLNAAQITELHNSHDGLPYYTETVYPSVSLNSPADDYSTINKNITFNCTATVGAEGFNITNISLSHNETGTWVVNQTNSTLKLSNSTSIFYVDFQDYGDIEWNCYACTDGGSCVYGDNRTLILEKFTVKSETHNATTYETARETFLINFDVAEDLEISLIHLVYNETNYTVSDIVISATTFNISKTIDIPINTNTFINETRSFFFRLTYAGADVQETDVYYQNVSFINLQLCNTTYSTEALNFTYYDEITSTEIDASANATSIQTTFNYWIGSGSVYKNYSYNNLTNNAASQYKFCIFPTWETFKTNMDLDYEAEAYSPRTYYLRNATLTNQTNEITLNLLTISDTVKFFITVLEGMVPFPNAIVTISKYFVGEGIYRTIGIRETDELGEFIEYLDLDKKYKYSIVRDGVSYGTIIKQASCTEAPCEITLQLEEAVVDMWQGYYDTHATNVAYTLFYNDTDKIVTYTFNDLTGLAQYFRLLVTQMSANQTGATICDGSLYSTAGTLTCNMTGYNGDFRATGYIHRSPGRTVNFILFIISTIKDTLGATGILVSLFIIITVALVGSWNPAVGVILVAFSVFMMKILGFVAFGYTTVILIFILAVILAIKMKT